MQLADLVTFNAVISACEKGQQWSKVLGLPGLLGLGTLGPSDVFCWRTGATAVAVENHIEPPVGFQRFSVFFYSLTRRTRFESIPVDGATRTLEDGKDVK